jgi:tripartite-type tricarboxylate transporter receptor subunit TctC
MNHNRRRILAMLGAAPALALGTGARASEFPSKAVRIIVPFGPGSGSDVYARYFGQQLADRIGQAVIVENKAGAGGAIAVRALQTAPADGYTILLGSNSPMAVNVSAYRQLPYDPVKDLRPLCGLTRSMAVLVVPNNSPLHTVEDLVARGKQQPQMNMGTYSAGYQLGIAPFLDEAGFKWQDVMYKGLSQTTTDVIGGQIDIAVIDTPGSVNVVNAGQMRAIAVTGTDRHPELPKVPTLVESGYHKAVHYSWTSLWVHADTPNPLVQRISDELLQVLSNPESAEFVRKNGGEIMPYNPERMRSFQTSEIKRFTSAVDSLNFKKI